ncbi:MAG: molybdenum cofactor synthesis protein [Paenibacillaceae bacterium]|jgi:molybdenum cofactor synthesis domain-containing protein|nr:molybdenum cofactor synthesis protein [Paenibacillaceae bacterium]
MGFRVGILAASDRGARKEREHTSAQVIRELVEEELMGAIVEFRIVPDEKQEIMAALIEMTDYYEANLVITTGGIGLKPRDVTPEATLEVVERLAPGFAEAIRSAMIAADLPEALCMRGISGLRGQSLILNLPADPKGVHESMKAVMGYLPTALNQLEGRESGDGGDGGSF